MRYLLLILFVSCAGYRYQQRNNPFEQYGIKSISIPIFYNHSNFSNISQPMTKEIFVMLTRFKGLRIKNEGQKADAVLIGIIESNDKIAQSRTGGNLRSVKNATGDLIGEQRGDFYIPSTTTVQANLRIILLKNPSDREIKLMKSSLGKFVVSSKVVFNESIPLQQVFTRELYDDESVAVINSQNRSALKKSVNQLAKNAAQSFRDMIIYAF